MLDSLSQTEKAFRDTTITKSNGATFDKLIRQYGIPRRTSVRRSYWREAVKANVFAPKGRSGPVFQFIYWALKDYAVPIRVSVSSSNPQRLTLSSSPNLFAQNHIDGWVRRESDGIVWKIAGPSDIATSSGNYVELSKFNSIPYWRGANFITSDTFSAEVLPFVIICSPGVVTVYISKAVISPVPPTYMQPASSSPATPDTVNQPADSEALTYNGGALDPVPAASPLIGADVRHVSEPDGGHVLLDTTYHGDPLGIGPHPIYLSGGNAFSEYEEILNPLLPSGVVCKFKLRP